MLCIPIGIQTNCDGRKMDFWLLKGKKPTFLVHPWHVISTCYKFIFITNAVSFGCSFQNRRHTLSLNRSYSHPFKANPNAFKIYMLNIYLFGCFETQSDISDESLVSDFASPKKDPLLVLEYCRLLLISPLVLKV